jgi:hypothetical protein
MSSSDRRERRKLQEDANRQGWEFTDKGRYGKLKCPCPERHIRLSVHHSPSNPNYWKELRAWLVRHTCWREDR